MPILWWTQDRLAEKQPADNQCFIQSSDPAKRFPTESRESCQALPSACMLAGRALQQRQCGLHHLGERQLPGRTPHPDIGWSRPRAATVGRVTTADVATTPYPWAVARAGTTAHTAAQLLPCGCVWWLSDTHSSIPDTPSHKIRLLILTQPHTTTVPTCTYSRYIYLLYGLLVVVGTGSFTRFEYRY